MKNTHNIDWNEIVKAYLEFLRNLTPIILFLSVGLYFFKNLQFFTLNLDNWKNTLIAFFSVIVAISALLVNSYNFIEIIIRRSSKSIDKKIRRLKRKKNRNLTVKEILKISWVILPMSLILAIFLLLFCFLIMDSAIFSVKKML